MNDDPFGNDDENNNPLEAELESAATSGGQNAAGQKMFTIEQANATLPLVRAIVKDLAELSREVVERRERLAHLLRGRRELQPDDPYYAELAQIEEELDKDRVRLQDYVAELRQLGAEPKDGLEGLVDFPAIIDGRPVYLCWKLGEPRIEFWHEMNAGFQGRRPLPRPTAVGGRDDLAR
jgi:hypothetical protein